MKRRQFLSTLTKTIAAGSAMVAFGVPDELNPIQVINTEPEYLVWDRLAESFLLELRESMKVLCGSHSMIMDQIMNEFGSKVGDQVGESINRLNQINNLTINK